MAEKITLKNTLANLPQKTDVDSIVATDASGNPVYIKKADLAQVVAELMPVATAEKQGVMSAAMSQKVLPLIQIMLTDTQSIIKITLSGKYVALCGCIGNYCNERLFLISSSRRVTGGQYELPTIKIIYKNGNLKFYAASNKEFVDVYISGIGLWGEFSALSFTGQVNSVSIVSEMPSTVTGITPIE